MAPGQGVFTEDFQRFRGTLGMGARLCKPNDPEAKGVNERANGYYETSFLPGRSFSDVADFNDQLTDLAEEGPTAGSTPRPRRSRRARSMRTGGPCARFPPVLPDPALRFSTRLAAGPLRAGRHQRLLGQPPLRRAGASRCACDLETRGGHLRRASRWPGTIAAWPSTARLLDPAHAMTLRMMRAEQTADAGASRPTVEERDLADYDRALGVA